jgi:hypothetical protein
MRQPSDAHIRTVVGIAWIVSDIDIDSGSHILRRRSIRQRHAAHFSAFDVP